MNEKAQVSVELILLLAAVVALVLIIVSQLQDTAEKASSRLSKKADQVLDSIDDIKTSK